MVAAKNNNLGKVLSPGSNVYLSSFFVLLFVLVQVSYFSIPILPAAWDGVHNLGADLSQNLTEDECKFIVLGQTSGPIHFGTSFINIDPFIIIINQ